MLEASALELVLLFLVACLGISSVAVIVGAVAEVVVLKLRHRQWQREKQYYNALNAVSRWPDRAGDGV